MAAHVLKRLISVAKIFRDSIASYRYKHGRIAHSYYSHSYSSSCSPAGYFADPIDPSESTFGKILIANRGEIACRVIKTAKAMGIKTVAVYSLPDSNSPHVRMADEAVCIGPAASRESYLNMEKILEVVDTTKSEAVHPGYGFLSENATFVKQLEDQGVAFIGPSAKAITGMGDKLESKRLAMAANVNTIPGFDGIIKDADHCVQISREIGYPVMIKASAGGGGKGMRIAWNDEDAREGFKLSTQEAASSFGDDRMLVEKYLENPRHIEIQVLGDKHGNAIFLNERECSIQRRNQKVIEEAPSVYIDQSTREAMGEQAVSLCKALGYSSAGTVEFLVDTNKKFYFLEMNTRLQVEHPITECITGIDLVHQMLRVAKGHSLKFKQNDVKIHGWAIESRVYAEDPYKNFGLPSVGRLYKYSEPTHIPNVRCDSGIEEGSEISIYYDPMICKLVCFGQTRADAVNTTVKALDSYVIRGVQHNIPLLRDIMTEENFLSGNISTSYLPKTYPEGFKGKQLSQLEKHQLMSIASVIFAKEDVRSGIFLNTSDTKQNLKPTTEWNLCVSAFDEVVPCSVAKSSCGYTVKVGNESLEVADTFSLSSAVIDTDVSGKNCTMQLLKKDASGNMSLTYLGTTFNVGVTTSKAAELLRYMPVIEKVNTSKVVISPMPGLVKSISCEVGDTVIEGQEVCIIEAMKMQNSLAAAATGKVKTVNFKVGNTVNEEDVLIEFE